MKAWSDNVKWETIPESMRGGVIRYIENGIPPGHFLQAIFKNDLIEACSRGDAENLALITTYVKLLWNQCPPACWGSQDHYRQWIARGGIAGNSLYTPLDPYAWSRWADQDHHG